MAEEEESTCFKCNFKASSSSALEVHLRGCTTEWEPHQPAPWTFIPPPDSFDRLGHRGRGRGRTQRGGRGRTRGDTVRRGRSGRQRGDDTGERGRGGWRGHGREGTWGGYRGWGRYNRGRRSSVGGDIRDQHQDQFELSSGLVEIETSAVRKSETYHVGNGQVTGPKCTKCQVSFDNPGDLAKHFNESPVHSNLASSPSKSSRSRSDSNIPPLSDNWYTTSGSSYATPRNTGPAQCTKCKLSFYNPQELASHFYESPAHPFSVPPVGNRWMAPARYRDAGWDGEIDDEMIDELVGVRFGKLGLD